MATHHNRVAMNYVIVYLVHSISYLDSKLPILRIFYFHGGVVQHPSPYYPNMVESLSQQKKYYFCYIQCRP